MYKQFLAFVFFLSFLLFADSQGFVQYQHLGTWTSEWNQQLNQSYSPVPPGCSPSTFILVARHGNRNPTIGTLKRLEQLPSFLKGVQNPSFAWMTKWKNPIPLNEAGDLVTLGEKSHYNLAKDFLKSFPSLLVKPYRKEDFYFRSTSVARTGVSAESFAYGLFEGSGKLPNGYQPVFVETWPDTSDNLLRFFENCPNYQDKVIHNPSAKEQAKLYEQMIFPKIIQKINSILGTNITSNKVKALWEACQMEAGVYHTFDGFCLLFDQESTLALEYWNDLEQYWLKSYAYDLSWQISVPLLQEVASIINQSMSSSPPPKSGNFYFAHAETVIPFTAMLGLYQDEGHLYANSSQEFIQNRKFRSSIIAPFTSNVAFSVYQCPSDFKLKVLLNEKEMQVPGCDGIYCSVGTFFDAFASRLGLDFDTLCSERKK